MRKIIFILITGFIYLQAQAQNDTLYTIDKCVNTLDTSKVEKTKAGYQYWFADKNFIDGRTIKLSVVKAHSASHPPHKHANDEFFVVLEGEAEFYLDGKTRLVKPLTSLYCPSNIEHGIRNVGDGELKYLVIKTYPKE
jgi:quercetin dioxygenase-like cupin family protein